MMQRAVFGTVCSNVAVSALVEHVVLQHAVKKCDIVQRIKSRYVAKE